ncbi:LacI family DNA-binding transcriptional regulator [Nocardia brevicatena]|uniref:LacI family DNA-binding transcriptional regulator n=1 Tax=Nocardia brevicatena TaxID=37327 RepID=UPI000592CB2D|nr:LacI family DNA-binding transcriptional regulator [Nocardia brevicatena]
MSRTQPELARLAGVSLSTVARWIRDPNSVREENRIKLERAASTKPSGADPQAERYDRAWSGSKLLTPRQAFLIVGTIDMWQDYLRAMSDSTEIDEISPFDSIDPRALFPVAGNKLWPQHAGTAMRSHIKMLTHGLHPVEESHSFFDELLFACSVADAPATEEYYLEAEIAMPGEIPLGSDQDFTDDEEAEFPWDDWESLMERILLGASPVCDALSALLPFDDVDPHVGKPDISDVEIPHPFTWFHNTIDGWSTRHSAEDES